MSSHEEAPDDRPSPLDRHQLSRLCRPALDDASAFLGEVVALFLEEVPPRLEAIRQALQTADQVEVRRLALHLRGCCVAVGATEMAMLCEHLEGGAKAVDLGGCKLILDQLRRSPWQLQQPAG